MCVHGKSTILVFVTQRRNFSRNNTTMLRNVITWRGWIIMESIFRNNRGRRKKSRIRKFGMRKNSLCMVLFWSFFLRREVKQFWGVQIESLKLLPLKYQPHFFVSLPKSNFSFSLIASHTIIFYFPLLHPIKSVNQFYCLFCVFCTISNRLPTLITWQIKIS